MAVITGHEVSKLFRHGPNRTLALDRVDFSIEAGRIVGLLGPDGAGKTTLLRLLTGLMRPTGGELRILDLDPVRQAREVQTAVGYMPQKFGLYEDLTLLENLHLFAELHAIPRARQQPRFDELLELTGLSRFTARLAGRLSGGMKQKLALICTMLAGPAVLLLDEPTVGVDPLSRRELWQILRQLTADGKLTALVSTAYMEEANYCHQTLILHDGRKLADGTPREVAEAAAGHAYDLEAPKGLKARQMQRYLNRLPGTVVAAVCGHKVHWVTTGDASGMPWPATPVDVTFEDGFLWHLDQQTAPPTPASGTAPLPAPPQPHPVLSDEPEVVVAVRDLVRRFGSFVAVDQVNFEVRRGEIFGLLGPNGAGKSTTFRMLCGLLPADEGTLTVAGNDLRRAAARARAKLGYMAQKFSLYGDLNAEENLRFFAGAYGLARPRQRERIQWAIEQFDLGEYLHLASARLPGGYKQRLSMACALLHEPEILFLDEPTSGADPSARREFWQRINELADTGVTVIITTHFLDEAEYCDRMVIMMDGKVLAEGAPDDIRQYARRPDHPTPTLEDAFLVITENYRSKGHEV